MSREIIALFDETGRATGNKDRAAAHRGKDRVGLCFVWAAWPVVLVQLRQLPRLGLVLHHVQVGRRAEHAAVQADEPHAETARREFAEEVGLALNPGELVFLGQLHLQDPSERYWRHAMQFFYLCTRPVALTATVFNEEVNAFVEVALADFDALVHGRVQTIPARARYESTPNKIRPREVTPAAFAAYNEQIMDAIRRSSRAIQTYLATGAIDATIFPASG